MAITKEKTIEYRGKSYVIKLIEMFDVDYGQNMEYWVGPMSLRDELEMDDFGGPAADIDDEIFAYCDDKIFVTNDTGEIIKELKDLTGLELEEPREEE